MGRRLHGLWRLPRDAWLIGLISLVNDGASDLIYPLLPLYLTSVLMAGPKALGLIEGIAEATSSLLKLASGALSDRSGHSRPWIVAGYGMASLARPLIALASSWPVVLLLRFFDRVGKGLRSSPRDALLASIVAPDQRGLAFGLHRAMDNAGAVIGPLAAAALLAWQVPLRQIFAWSLLPGVVCTVMALALREPASEQAKAPEPVDWKFSALPPALRRYLPWWRCSPWPTAPTCFCSYGPESWACPSPRSPCCGRRFRRWPWSAPHPGGLVRSHRSAPAADGWLCGYGLFYWLIGQLQAGGPRLVPLFASYGLFLSATEGVEKALVADLSSAGQRGTAFGWFNLTTGLMVLPASMWGCPGFVDRLTGVTP